jgi:hypothetical protein
MSYNAVEPGFLEKLGIPLLEGRDLSRSDTRSAAGCDTKVDRIEEPKAPHSYVPPEPALPALHDARGRGRLRPAAA